MDEDIRVLTDRDTTESEIFSRMKRRKWGGFRFLMRGEWAQDPWHEGHITFAIASTTDRCHWALKSIGWPTRIVAVAVTSGDIKLERVAGTMMGILEVKGGEYIESNVVDECDDQLDLNELWSWRRSAKKQARESESKKRDPKA